MTNSLHASKKLGVIPRVGRIRAQKKKQKKNRQTDKEKTERKRIFLRVSLQSFLVLNIKLVGLTALRLLASVKR